MSHHRHERVGAGQQSLQPRGPVSPHARHQGEAEHDEQPAADAQHAEAVPGQPAGEAARAFEAERDRASAA